MSRDVSKIVSGAGMFLSFITALDKAVIKNGGDETDIHRLTTRDGEPDLDQIAKIIVGQSRPIFPSSWKTLEFPITPSTQTTMQDLVEDWKKAGKSIDSAYINSNITDANFLTNVNNLSQTNCKIILVNFGKRMTIEQALAEGAKYGLKQPTIQQGITFATQYPDIQREKWIVVPHKPRRRSCGGFDALCLDGDSDGRSLYLRWYDNGWRDVHWFLFVGD